MTEIAIHRPDAQRCMIYTRRGVGHGEVNLSDALAMSCNVYFFQAAGALGTAIDRCLARDPADLVLVPRGSEPADPFLSDLACPVLALAPDA